MRISFADIRVVFGDHRALDGVSAELTSGEVTAIVGPSGAGKSTLLGVLSGLVAPQHGRVRFDDQDVTSLPPEQRGLGVVFQDLRLFDFMSGRDNVAFAGKVARLDGAEQRRRVDAALALVRAEAFALRPARVLSGGERQRIALARAIAMQPRALLLDEPLSAVDAELRRELREELRELVRGLGCTTLLVTHDRDDAFALATRIVVLRQGRVEQTGDPLTLYRQPTSEYVAHLLGEASLLPIEERQAGRVLVLGRWIEATGSGTHVMLRPEDVITHVERGGWAGTLKDARYVGVGWRATYELAAGHSLVALTDEAPPTITQLAPRRSVHALGA